MPTVLSTQNLTKHYGRIKAVSNLSINVKKGSVYGILGPNGSGKTTTLGILLDVLHPTSGSYQWFEEPPSHQSRKRIGAILETPNFYPYLSAVKNLQIAADIKGAGYHTIEPALKMVNLLERKKDAFKNYSLGMRQRLSLAAALLGDPEVLVLDEPTNGLDPEGIAEVRELIIEVARQGKTIILASHLLNEVERVCSHVAVLKNGNLLAEGKVSEVLSEEELIEVGARDSIRLKEALADFRELSSIKQEGNYFLVALKENTASEELNAYLHSKGVSVNHLLVKKQSLESHFMELIKKDNGTAA